ncbi:hypothetical protein LTR67_002550 [Exophiala xenobiotica]
MASTPGPIMELLGRIAYEIEVMQPLFPTYLHLLVSAIFPIYTAAHASLSRPTSAAPRKRKKGVADEDEPDEGDSQKIESLTPSDALLFPLLAGATLASLYFILKWLQDPAWLNWVLGIYFSQIGLFFATKFLKDTLSVLRSFLLPNQRSSGGKLWKVDQQECCIVTERGEKSNSPFPGLLRLIPLPASITKRIWKLRGLLYKKAHLNLHVHGLITVKSPVDILDVVSLLLSCALVSYHGFVSKPWFLTNFLGFSFCYGSLQYMTPTTAWTGTLVLSALFFYDIYFVFFTPMMVTVATKLDVPIKLLFPRPDGCVFPVGAPEGSSAMEEYLQCLAKKRTMAMLGLGDIVVPGMMLAFALRFDLFLFYLRQGRKGVTAGEETQKPAYVNAKGNWGERFWTNSKLWTEEIKAKTFPKPYFYATIVGYLAGMITTVVVMQVAEHAQPALLYLVPGVLLSLWGTALVRGDLKALWDYSELPEEEKKDGKEDNEKDKTESDADTSKAVVGSGAAESREVDQKSEEHKTESDPDKSNDKGPAKEKAEKQCRRLVYFSIILPEQQPESKSEEPSASTTPHAQANATGDTLSEDTGKSTSVQHHMNGAMEERQGRKDGEPPEKRARRV